MQTYQSYLGSKHPILCLPMNQVSDVNLAIAVHNAGAFPSIIITNYLNENKLDTGLYSSELRRFKDATGSNLLLLSIGFKAILYDAVTEPFFNLGFKHIELFHHFSEDSGWQEILDRCKYLEDKYDAKIIFKVSTNNIDDETKYKTIILKGVEAAGRASPSPTPIKEKFIEYRSKFPHLDIIPCGGVYDNTQLKFFMDQGALAVGVGSLFAASEESCLSTESKMKIIKSSTRDITSGGTLNFKGLFSNIVDNDDINLTKSLSIGVRDPDNGCIYIGDAIDHITEILPIKVIVERLINYAVS